jgi:hypothetical protein
VSARLLTRLAGSGTFLLFVDALERRLDEGRALDALEMLKEVGAPAGVAWQIIDQWPEGPEPPYPSRKVAAAVRLAHFVPTFDRGDWPTMLKRALRAEAVRNRSG